MAAKCDGHLSVLWRKWTVLYAGCLAARKSEIFLRNGEFRTARLYLQFLIGRKQRKKPKAGEKKKTGEGEKDKTRGREKEKTPLNDRNRQ